jgi:signal transduction histidine kinase
MSEAGAGRRDDAWVAAAWVWDAGFYVLFGLSTLIALAENHSGRARLLVGVLAVALAAWHTLFLPRLRALGDDDLGRPLVYLAGATLLWFALLHLSPGYFLALWILYPLAFRLLPLRLAIGWALLLTALSTVRQFLESSQSLADRVVESLYGVTAATAGILLGVFIHRIIGQSQERRDLIRELEAAQAGLAAAERQAGVLEERERLAREIHDTLAQGFTSIVLLVQAAEAAWAAGSPVAGQHLAQARRTAGENLAEARRLVWALQPEPLSGASLAEALARLTERLGEEDGLEAATAVTGAQRPLPTPVEVALLRVAQEALANVRRHAKASRVTVTLSYMEDVAVLDVQDDGVGFDVRACHPAAPGQEGGFGLEAMRQRVARLGGTLAIESAPGSGTTLVVKLPLGEEDAA